MKRKIYAGTLALMAFLAAESRAGEFPLSKGGKPSKKKNLLKEMPNSYFEKETVSDSTAPEPEFKPSIQLGSIVHMFASYSQDGFGPGPGSSEDWGKGFNIYRARVLVGGQLSKNGSFFFETDLPSLIGTQKGAGVKNVEVSQLVLDCQYEHKFADYFYVIAGKQLVSNNRNGLQGAASLMANDFTFWQYSNNMFGSSPLQGNYGRDLGINTRGLLLKDKLEYRLGLFTGRSINGTAPLRTVGRVVYNFLDADKSFYYSGTNLGKGKTISLGAGFDAQANYSSLSTDLFIDVPITTAGSVTFNGAFQYQTGGADTSSMYSFTKLVPKQTVLFGELGYYFKAAKLQPYIRFENQAISAESIQTPGSLTGDALSKYNKANSSTIFGGGLNYFFNGYGTNLRLSYTTYNKGIVDAKSGDVTSKTFGQTWLQLQFFFF